MLIRLQDYRQTFLLKHFPLDDKSKNESL